MEVAVVGYLGMTTSAIKRRANAKELLEIKNICKLSIHQPLFVWNLFGILNLGFAFRLHPVSCILHNLLAAL